MSAQREMTLVEWCERLPMSHRVRKELEELQKDKLRLDWMETQLCWIGIEGVFDLRAKEYGGKDYIETVRECCDKHLK